MSQNAPSHIEKWYENPKKPKWSYKAPLSLVSHRPALPPVVSPSPVKTETERAHARNLTVEEYRHRVACVAKEVAKLTYMYGDTVVPVNPEDEKTLGKCLVVHIARHYDDYGDVEWNEPPYIVSLMPLKDRSLRQCCSAGWVKKHNQFVQVLDGKGDC